MAVEERIRVFVDEERARGDLGQKKRWRQDNEDSQELGESSSKNDRASQKKDKKGRDAISAEVPGVSSKYDLTSSELSFEGIVNHEKNKKGFIVFLKAVTSLDMNLPKNGCIRSCIFGECSMKNCAYSHDTAAFSDTQRLAIRRRARDLVLAGKSA